MKFLDTIDPTLRAYLDHIVNRGVGCERTRKEAGFNYVTEEYNNGGKSSDD